MIEVLRVDDGHWHPVPEDGSLGTAYELETHPFTAQRVYEGHVVHRDREELADSLVGTDEDDTDEVALAATRFADLVATSSEARRHGPRLPADRGAVAAAATARAPGRTAAGSSPLMPVACWCWPPWARRARSRWPRSPGRTPSRTSTCGSSWCGAARATCCPAPASLLAFAAWQHGDGALAWCAIDRCLEVDPDYAMAHCVADVLTRAVPPTAWEQMRRTGLSVFSDDTGSAKASRLVTELPATH